MPPYVGPGGFSLPLSKEESKFGLVNRVPMLHKFPHRAPTYFLFSRRSCASSWKQGRKPSS